MRALRLALQSYRDFYDRIWWMLLLTAVWWCMLITVVFAPSATLLLFKHADPRIGTWRDRDSLRTSGQYLWSELIRGWMIALATLPLIGLMAFNLAFYGGDSALSFLAPIWLVLLILAISGTLIIFALAGAQDLPARDALLRGARVTGIHLPAALVILFVTAVVPIMVITSTLYFLLPLAVMIPGLIATAFTTFVLRATGTPLPEPNAPTEERLHEKQSG